jgi:sugar phosphate isomerase/epimerase
MNRRQFLLSSTASLACLAGASCRTTEPREDADLPHSKRIAFNTANLVGRVSGYRYELAHWVEQHKKTVAATDERAWDSICQDIAAAGYTAIEVWEAHAAPESLNAAKAKSWGRIMKDHGLEPIGYAGDLGKEAIQICQWLGIPRINGGLHDLGPETATKLCRDAGINFNLENHPEKSVADILRPIAGGSFWLGVCIDTGWLGTQGVSAPTAIRDLKGLVRHVHVKDVRRTGGHETCRLGDGIVDIPAVLSALKAIGYTGWYSWEDEPEDRNPMELAGWTLHYLKQQLG